MLKFKKVKGNLIHKTAVINWKKIKIGKGNIIGPYVVIGNVPQWKNKKTVGKIETRTSKSFPGDLIEKRPSCGRRFSAIFKLDRILILVTKPLKEAIGGVMIV